MVTINHAKKCRVCAEVKHYKKFDYGRNICNQCKYLSNTRVVKPVTDIYPASVRGNNQ